MMRERWCDDGETTRKKNKQQQVVLYVIKRLRQYRKIECLWTSVIVESKTNVTKRDDKK